jgi:uncharacterized protein (TIGR02466 family)
MSVVRNLSPGPRSVPRLDNSLKATARDLFASPIVLCEWPETEKLNAELAKLILEHYRSSPSVVQSARYAWQSGHDMHKWDHPSVAEFVGMLKAAASRMAAHVAPEADQRLLDGWEIVSCFANVTPPGGFSQAHDHIDTGASISGVYYVDLGEVDAPEFAGRTILQDRSGAARPTWKGRDPFSREYAVVPKPGVALLFPAAQVHYVEPYRGKTVRISIAFNMSHPDFDVAYYPGMEKDNWWWRNFRGFMIMRTKIPEMLRTLALLPGYVAQEGRRPGRSSFLRRVKSAFQRAEVDAQAKKAEVDTSAVRLPEKNELN